MSSCRAGRTPRWESLPWPAWYRYCVFQKWVYRLGAVLAGIMSILLLWSECTFSVESPKLSIFYLLLKAAGTRTFGVTVRARQHASMRQRRHAPYALTCAAARTPHSWPAPPARHAGHPAVHVHLRVQLAHAPPHLQLLLPGRPPPHRQQQLALPGRVRTGASVGMASGPISLTYRCPRRAHGAACSMLCRLTFPLCYNFLFLVDIKGTVFQSVRRARPRRARSPPRLPHPGRCLRPALSAVAPANGRRPADALFRRGV